MEITNEFRTEKIEFVIIESLKEHFPSHRIEIVVKTENIQAFNNYVWLSEADINGFIKELETLDATRKGQAKLESMSPEEMSLIFKAIGTAGHIAVGLQIIKNDRTSSHYSFNLNVQFQIDPTALLYIRGQFSEFIKG